MAKITGKKEGQVESKIPTLISSKCVIRGNIKNAAAIRIEGMLIGDIQDAGQLIVGEAGVIKGDVRTKSITVFGRIDGNVSATDSIHIKSSGKVSGRLRTQTLSVEQGAVYHGEIAIGSVNLEPEHGKISIN